MSLYKWISLINYVSLSFDKIKMIYVQINHYIFILISRKLFWAYKFTTESGPTIITVSVCGLGRVGPGKTLEALTGFHLYIFIINTLLSDDNPFFLNPIIVTYIIFFFWVFVWKILIFPKNTTLNIEYK